jgi:hypothetical protein
MKTWTTCLLGLSLSAGVLAGPLQPAHIAADARWLIHLDLEALQPTTVGQTLAREAIEPKMSEVAAALKLHLGFDFDWRRIRSITLYGAEYGGPERLRGVMLVDTDLDLVTAFDRALQKQAEWGRAQDGDLQRLEDGPQPLYCIKEDLYVALQPGAPAVIGKARRTTLKARAVLVEGAPNLNTAPGLANLANAGHGEFLLVAAEGFGAAAPDAPQARVLKMADTLRFSLAETSGQLQAALTLGARSAETAQQMQQVIQGMTALVALSQTDNADLQKLVNGLRASVNDRQLQLSLTLPAADVAAKIAEDQRRKRGQTSTTP